MHTRSWLAISAVLLTVLGCRDDATSPTEPVVTNTAAAVSNAWITRKDLWSNQYSHFATAVVPNAGGQSTLYVIGGITSSGSVFTSGGVSKVMAYDVATNRWTAKASLPLSLHSTNGAGVISGRIYISGGLSGRKAYRDELYMYDPETNTWTPKQPLPITGYWGVTGVIDNRLYVVTSCNYQEDCLYYGDYGLPAGHPDRWLFRYDPMTATWTELAIPPIGLSGYPYTAFGATIGKKLYVGIGGSNILQLYDPVTNTWVEQATPRALRSGAAFAALAGKLYMAGGIRWNADYTYSEVRATNVYDPATNTWTNKAPLPAPRAFIAGNRVVVSGQPRIAVVGGLRPGNTLQYIP
jgi:N-acetylneuraminic acid mutarotase